MGIQLNLKGKVFGRLTVLQQEKGRSKCRGIKWLCLCQCGEKVSVVGSQLKRGNTRSCGCLQKDVASKSSTTHGLKKHPLYNIWSKMKMRCTNSRDRAYKYYGGRGITVCDRWLNSFENFYEDMKDGYKKGLELDRRDNDSGYSSDNCRWVTRQQNVMNRRGAKIGTSRYKGVSTSKNKRSWISKVSKDGISYYLGTFHCEKEAALAYNKKAKGLFKEYANLNILED